MSTMDTESSDCNTSTSSATSALAPAMEAGIANFTTLQEHEPITQEHFDKLHGRLEKTENHSLCGRKIFTKHNCRNALKSLFPIVGMMRNYSRQDFFYDVLAGITICIMNIPQGMAYSRLAELPPVYGLYTSMFPALIYFFFGTSRHLSIGTVVAVSLAIENAVCSVMESPPDYISRQRVLGPDESVINETYLYDGQEYTAEEMRLKITISLTLLTGFVHLLLGVLRLGFFVAFFSETMLNGFVAGLCVHLVTTQLTYLLGYGPSKKYEGLCRLFFIYWDMIRNLSKINLVLLPLSIFAVLVLWIFKDKIQPKISKYIKFPIPIDLVLIIIGILLGRFVKLSDYKIATVGKIPSGLPSLTIPDVRLFQPLMVQGIMVAIIGYAETVAIAKPFALKHSYKLDTNQELIAIGTANVFSSFFTCFSCSPALSRSLVMESVGARSQVTGLVNVVGLLLVLLFIAPLFETLPNFVLAAIILVSLRSVARQFAALPSLYRESRYDFAVWVVACVSTVITNAMYGLAISCAFTILSIVWRIRQPQLSSLGLVNGTEEYQDTSRYADAMEFEGVKIFRFEGPLYFVSTDHFRASLFKAIRVKEIRKLKKQSTATKPLLESISIDLRPATLQQDADALQFIVVDCSAISFVDPAGTHMLKLVINELKKDELTVLLAAMSHEVLNALQSGGFFASYSKELLFVNITDAVAYALRHRQLSVTKTMDDCN